MDKFNSLFITCDVSLNMFTRDFYNLNIFFFNHSYISVSQSTDLSNMSLMITIFYFLNKFFKISLLVVVLFCIFSITNFELYIKQLNYSSSVAKFFLLNETEKEIGPVDDFFFFIILFIVTLSSFVFISIFYLIMLSNVFV